MPSWPVSLAMAVSIAMAVSLARLPPSLGPCPPTQPLTILTLILILTQVPNWIPLISLACEPCTMRVGPVHCQLSDSSSNQVTA